jgi:hypothetical protein
LRREPETAAALSFVPPPKPFAIAHIVCSLSASAIV